MTKLEPYAEYKNSSIEWLGMVPTEWTVIKTGQVTRLTTGWTPPTGDSDAYVGDNLWANISDLGPKILQDTSKRISNEAVASARIARSRKGSLLFSFKLSVGQVSFAGTDMYTNEAIATFEETDRLSVRFAYYALPIYLLQNANTNIYGAKLLNQDLMKSARLCLPSKTVQDRIADFLDRETIQIDGLIAKQDRLIELLAEKRQAIITRAVTKGLDPTAPTKPSGIPWLGDIPAAWTVSKLSWNSRGIGDGLHGTPTYSDFGLIPFVNGTNLLGGEIRITDSTNFVDKDQLSNADNSLDESTVLISINGTIGNCAVLGDQQVMLSKSAAYIKCSEDLNVHFLAHYLRSAPTRSYFFASSGGTTIANLSLATLRGTPVPIPPMQIQQEIIDWLDGRIRSIDDLGAKASAVVRLLRERRSALISAAVTGKIKVREGAV